MKRQVRDRGSLSVIAKDHSELAEDARSNVPLSLINRVPDVTFGAHSGDLLGAATAGSGPASKPKFPLISPWSARRL